MSIPTYLACGKITNDALATGMAYRSPRGKRPPRAEINILYFMTYFFESTSLYYLDNVNISGRHCLIFFH